MAKQSKLNKSWFDKSVRKTKLVTGLVVYRDRGYIRGIKEFQNKAIEELEKELHLSERNPIDNSLDKMYNGALLQAIKLIKNLKA